MTTCLRDYSPRSLTAGWQGQDHVGRFEDGSAALLGCVLLFHLRSDGGGCQAVWRPSGGLSVTKHVT